MAVAYVMDDVSLGHQPPGPHPECPERFQHASAGLMDHVGDAVRLPARAANLDELGRVHTAGYLGELERLLPGNTGWLDPDTYYSPGTWPALLHAAGAAVDVAAALLDGRARRAIALVRPPGHHAEADRGVGFCIVNNVAVAAAAARAAGAQRVAIVDWDVHHGNGTQAIFWRDPSVLYASVHQWPLYPGTGAPVEVGDGDGRGATVNVGLPAGAGDADWLAAFDEVVVPALDRFRPDLVLVSAGFDAYRDDPLAQTSLDAGAYRAMTERLIAVAERHADGRIALVLEGGYDLPGLARCVGEAAAALVDRPAAARPPLPSPSPMARAAIGRSRTALGLGAQVASS